MAKANWSSFTKAELIKTVKRLDARQTKLLNRIAELERPSAYEVAKAISNALRPEVTPPASVDTFGNVVLSRPPWATDVDSLPNPFEGDK